MSPLAEADVGGSSSPNEGSPRADVADCPGLELELMARNAADAVTDLMRLLRNDPGVSNPAVFERDLAERQSLGPSFLGPAIAFPHVRTTGVSRTVMAVGRSGVGIRFDAEHPAVRLVIVVGAPAFEVGQYLLFTSRLARRLGAAGRIQRLLAASTQAEFLAAWRL